MAESKKHRETAKRIAKKEGTEYNSGQGPDIKGKRVIEVETEETVADGPRQLRGFRGPVYIAGVDEAAVKEALKKTDGTTIGVMNNKGSVVKRSTRKKRKRR